MNKENDKITDGLFDRFLMFFVMFMSAIVPAIFVIVAGLLFISNCGFGGTLCAVFAVLIYKPVAGFEFRRKIDDDGDKENNPL